MIFPVWMSCKHLWVVWMWETCFPSHSICDIQGRPVERRWVTLMLRQNLSLTHRVELCGMILRCDWPITAMSNTCKELLMETSLVHVWNWPILVGIVFWKIFLGFVYFCVYKGQPKQIILKGRHLRNGMLFFPRSTYCQKECLLSTWACIWLASKQLKIA